MATHAKRQVPGAKPLRVRLLRLSGAVVLILVLTVVAFVVLVILPNVAVAVAKTNVTQP